VPKPRKKMTDPRHSLLDDQPPRRAAILAAAFTVLMDHGYAGASTLEIATRAKVSKRELYAEFGSKRGILEALIAATAERMQVPLNPAEIGDRHALAEALRRYGATALGELTAPAVVAINRVAVAEASRSADLGRILHQSGREPNRLALGRLLGRAQAAGFIGAGDPDRMAGQFFALLFGDTLMQLLLGVAEPPSAREIAERAEAATAAVLALNPA
jgi:AcrR family transcriptional regulator